MNGPKFEAPPLSRAAIVQVASRFRNMFGLDDPFLPVERVIEHAMPAAMPGFVFEVLTVAEMGNRHGFWDPQEKTLALREDVYAGLLNNHGRDRFTAMHEVGHAVLHRVTLNRVSGEGVVSAFRDPEWQANTFAAAALMPISLMPATPSIRGVMQEFGVTSDAAQTWMRKNRIFYTK